MLSTEKLLIIGAVLVHHWHVKGSVPPPGSMKQLEKCC